MSSAFNIINRKFHKGHKRRSQKKCLFLGMSEHHMGFMSPVLFSVYLETALRQIRAMGNTEENTSGMAYVDHVDFIRMINTKISPQSKNIQLSAERRPKTTKNR